MIIRFHSHHQSFLPFVLVAAVLAITLSGCTSLSSLSNGSVPPTTAKSAGSYRVEMLSAFGKKSVYTGQLTEPTTVQMALNESGAIEKFRNLDVAILRVVSETGQALRMDVRFDPKEDAVAPEHDYAILPNDRIVVQPKSDNILDKMLESIAGK